MQNGVSLYCAINTIVAGEYIFIMKGKGKMSTGAKVWLWILFVYNLVAGVIVSGVYLITGKAKALAAQYETLGLDMSEKTLQMGFLSGVILSVIVLVGISLLLFMNRKAGFYVILGETVISVIYTILTTPAGPMAMMTIVIGVIMSVLGVGITFLVLRKSWDMLK